MTELKSDLMKAYIDRGYMHQCTDQGALDDLAATDCVIAYIGFDCTASSFHVGNLVPIMMLRVLQRHGHKPIVLMGDGTTKVGDPSGKDQSRQLLTTAQIDANKESLKRIFAQFLTFGDGPSDAMMVSNAEWLDRLNYIEFLRDYGRHFSVNRMLSFDSVRLRLDREQPLSFLEFNYMILQAYDFLELARRHGCALQMGGSDQWGNIVNGVELGRRVENRGLFGLTTPLITTASGVKMGKTAQGAVWLNAEELSPYDYWQFWRNTEDADVGRFLKLFTELPLDDIARLEGLEGQDRNEAKKILATEATRLCHGDDAATTAAETARQTFEQGQAAENLPTFDMARGDLDGGIFVYDLLNTAGLCNSNGEARRLIKSGGARVNDTAVTDEKSQLTAADADADGIIKLSAGKKRHALIRVS
jgi:tyrosyl-tRNA synthetase